MVVIRLSRGGAKKKAFYHIVVADKRRARNGKYIEQIGYFNPFASGKDVGLNIEREKLAAWVARGAQLSDRVQCLVAQFDAKVA